MKHSILLTLALLSMISLHAQYQDEEAIKPVVYRNQMLIAPFYFFDETLMFSYERIFPSNGALRITPSVTLSNVENDTRLSREGFGLDMGYKAFIVDKSKRSTVFNVYIGPYVMYKHVSNSRRDFASPSSIKKETMNVLSGGFDAGIKLTVGRFVLDFTLGGGIRYPQLENPETVSVTSYFDDEYKGIVPRINLFVGVTL